MTPSMCWDVFCRVVDNFGDIGVCWRLAAGLASRGQQVRLWADDARALQWMAPGGAPGVTVLPWTGEATAFEPGDVVVETFGCDPPADFVARMAARSTPPVWINLEYLSAESYVERSHRLRSPQASGPGRGLDKWFFYPGFTPATGGLLREPGLLAERDRFERGAWLAAHGIAARPGERLVSLFCYPGAALELLFGAWPGQPTLLLACPGAAAEALAGAQLPAGWRSQALPWLSQADYDRLLWACDLNAVRGEDSFVRAQWAGRPLLWHIYPQHDAAHDAKLEAFLARHLAGAAPGPAAALRRAMRAWNGLPDTAAAGPAPTRAGLPALADWAGIAADWRRHLALQPDLVTQLLGFVAEKR